jgi:predicted SprT family Zn-dependent metalloprotease
MLEKKVKRIPIARCPNPDCSRTLLFSCDPKDKLRITTKIADENYQGKTMICSRCKTIVAIIEKPKVAHGYVAIPIMSTTV